MVVDLLLHIFFKAIVPDPQMTAVAHDAIKKLRSLLAEYEKLFELSRSTPANSRSHDELLAKFNSCEALLQSRCRMLKFPAKEKADTFIACIDHLIAQRPNLAAQKTEESARDFFDLHRHAARELENAAAAMRLRASPKELGAGWPGKYGPAP